MKKHKKVTKMKKIYIVVMAVVMMAMCSTLFVGCKSYDYKIGINQFASAPALDLANKGFKDTLNEWAQKEGKSIKFFDSNASGEFSNATTIAQSFASRKDLNLVYAIATPSATPTASKVTVPVVYTAVTDPKTADLEGKDNVTGTADSTPTLIEEQLKLLMRIKPNTKKVAMLYCSGESNSEAQVKRAKAYLTKNHSDVETKDFTAAKVDEINAVTNSIVMGKYDMVFIPTDNLMASNMGIVARILKEAKIPSVAGEAGMVNDGAFATIGVDYYKLGQQSAEMAIKILTGTSPKDIPWDYFTKELEIVFNDDTAISCGYNADQIAAIKAQYGK